jgi:shikimate dehydrogenase
VTEAWSPGGRTRLVAIIGHPVRHSLSPALHNAAFRALALDWAYLAFDIPPGEAPAALEAVRTLGIDGLNVTMPHKRDVAAEVDELSDAARALDAVNTVVRIGDRLIGHNTDGQGFVDALRIDENIDVAGMSCAVVGSGGAARAVVQALAAAGAAEIAVVARRADAAEEVTALAPGVASVSSARAIGDVVLVVNATPVGMDNVVGIDPAALPFDAGLIHPGHIVADLVYDPLVTPLVAEARRRGAVAINGLGMLLHQAAGAFRLWTGQDAPLATMSAAAMHVVGSTTFGQPASDH